MSWPIREIAAVEVPLSEREWVEGMKKLSDVIDAELDHVLIYDCHGVAAAIVIGGDGTSTRFLCPASAYQPSTASMTKKPMT